MKLIYGQNSWRRMHLFSLIWVYSYGFKWIGAYSHQPCYHQGWSRLCRLRIGIHLGLFFGHKHPTRSNLKDQKYEQIVFGWIYEA